MATPKLRLDFLWRPERELGLLVTPSVLSGLLVIVAGLLITIGTVVKLQYHRIGLEHLAYTQYAQSSTVSESYQVASNNLASNSFIADIPVLVFWAGIGLVVYGLCRAIFNMFQSVAVLHEEMDYVHSNRKAMVREAILHVAVRSAALGIWIVFLSFTIHDLLPYAIAVAYAASGVDMLLDSILYVAWGTIILLVTFHIHVVLARLFFLRPRLFGFAE